MCGIVAIYHQTSKPVDRELLTRMADRIAHRGPDDEGVFIDGNIGFYHKRLSVIDLRTGRQPMTDDSCTIVFNGEIYNYIELRQELVKKGESFQTNSDTEVILKMYRKFGEEGINRLNGMFAFLLYDRKNRKLIAARDHFGIKPLYLYQDEEQLIFASEIKALLVHPEIRAACDQDALNEYLTFQFVPGGNTLFRGIKKILPGHYLVVDLRDNSIREVNYWTPDFSADQRHSEEYFVYELQRLLEDSVKMQLRSDVPLGVYLSGGTDSSLIAMLASRHLSEGLNTFTGAFREGGEGEFDESKYAALIADQCGARMFRIYPEEKDFVETLPGLIYHLDEPVGGPGLFPQYMVSKVAAEEVKVVLGGQGGDEIFGGYARYVVAYLEQAIKEAIFQTNEEDEHLVALSSIAPNLPALQRYIPMLRRFWKKGAFEEMDRRYFHLIDRSEGALSLYSADFRKQYDKERIFSGFQRIFNHPDTRSYYNKMTHFDLFGSLPGLLQVEDRMSMAVSLESRVPLLDKRIVNLIASIPARMKFKGAEMKYLLKLAARNILPQAIIDRRDKMGFPVPLHLWLSNGGITTDFVRDVLLSKRCSERGIFDTRKLESLIQDEGAFGRSLWGALSVELWYRAFMDN